MAAFTKYNFFVDEMAKGGHNLATAVLVSAHLNTAVFSWWPPIAISSTKKLYLVNVAIFHCPCWFMVPRLLAAAAS